MLQVQRDVGRAVDEHGHDMSARIAQLDRTCPDDFALESVRGYAAEHALTLDLGEAQSERGSLKASRTNVRTLLLLTGWTDYAFSSDNVAAAQ